MPYQNYDSCSRGSRLVEIQLRTLETRVDEERVAHQRRSLTLQCTCIWPAEEDFFQVGIFVLLFLCASMLRRSRKNIVGKTCETFSFPFSFFSLLLKGKGRQYSHILLCWSAGVSLQKTRTQYDRSLSAYGPSESESASQSVSIPPCPGKLRYQMQRSSRQHDAERYHQRRCRHR